MDILIEYIAQGEHLKQDFKFRIDDQKKIARTLCAFANTEGGRLLIGVKDNGKIAGVDPQEEFFMIDGAAGLFCKPEVHFKSVVHQVDHKLVLEVVVEKDAEIIHNAQDDDGKWRAYMRVGDQTILVNKIIERVWKQKRSPISKPEKFDQEELNFLKVINEHQPVSISKLYRTANLPLKRIDRLLVLLICWGLVSFELGNDGVLYSLSVDK
jgi:predicted HTH transcriptional regulator